ncbi:MULTISPECIES: S-layer protein [Haloferacaceae]|uniref:S-layer protein n=1 Tax=Halorubrum glutamatedens TaxID=2707018 RepID=A0ABD5QMK4_9EURY|nr:S-layer protein [Halobellus captivus]
MNVKDSIKKVGAVAASTLMVGMTMGAAQSLSEFPGMFVGDDGAPTAQVVVGSQGAVSDVVGAVNVAAALGQATIQTSEQTETVDVETSGGSVGWSASDGQTLDTRNDNLYFGDTIDTVRQTLTEEHLDMLATTEFQDAAGNDQDVEHFLYTQGQQIKFGTASESNVDPFLYVDNPANPSSVTGGLYKLQANFGEGLLLDPSGTEDDGDSDGNDDVLGEEIDMFGQTFTISSDSFTGNDQLILYGSSEEYDLETGESTEIDVDGETHTLEVRAVTASDTVAFYVDGSLQEKTEGQTVNVGGTDVRIDDVILTNSQNSEGLVTFSIGSEEYRLEDGQPVQDSDGDDIEGTYVKLTGDGVESGSTETLNNNNKVEVSSVEIGVGADDSDNNYVESGGTFEDPIFTELRFHLGGLAPDAGEGAGDQVGEVMFDNDGDETVTVDFTDGDNDATIEWWYDDATGGDGAVDDALADSDDHSIMVYEGASVAEDEYFFSDAGDFDHMWEVTGVDASDSDSGTAEEGTVDLQDVVTGANVEVEVTETGTGDGNDDSDDTFFTGTEVIDGQTYKFRVDGGTDEVQVVWDAGSSVSESGYDVGNMASVYPAVDTDSGASIALHDDVDEVIDADVAVAENDARALDKELVFPSTESTGTQTAQVVIYDDGTADQVDINVGGTWYNDTSTAATDSNEGEDVVSETVVDVGALSYRVSVNLDDHSDDTDSTTSDEAAFSVDVAPENSGSELTSSGAMVIEPEHETGSGDAEAAYNVVPGVDDSDDWVEVGGSQAILWDRASTFGGTTLDSDDSVTADYDVYGAHVMKDDEDQGSFTLHVPNQQAVAGAAFTGSGGELSMGGGSGTGSGEVTYTGVTNEDIRGALPDLAKTDDQVTSSDRQNSHLILVGGPAVNTLVSDLADDGETWTTDQWRNEHVDEALLQVVEDAFADGQHAMIVAGHSADDTRAAARYVSEWRSHQDTLADAGMQYSPSSQEAPR